MSLEDKLFVRYFSAHFKVDIVVHVLFTSNPDNLEDKQIGLQRWFIRIYYRDGSAIALHQGLFTSFTVLDSALLPHQIILYQVESPVDKKDKKKKTKPSKKEKRKEKGNCPLMHFIPILSMIQPYSQSTKPDPSLNAITTEGKKLQLAALTIVGQPQ